MMQFQSAIASRSDMIIHDGLDLDLLSTVADYALFNKIKFENHCLHQLHYIEHNHSFKKRL